MPSYGGSPFSLSVEAAGVSVELVNESNHSAGWSAGGTLEEFLGGKFHAEVVQYLGQSTLDSALAAARSLAR